MSYLLIDNSNTRTKFALHVPGPEIELRVMPTADISVPSVQKVLEGWSFESVCLCSVVPWAVAPLREACGGAEVQMLDSSVSDAVDFSDYAGLATLGADRVANVLAAVRRAELPLVAVDAGTATTFDVVVSKQGKPRFAGGVIAPGINAMAGCLHYHTAQLPIVRDWQSVPVIGGDTAAAMGSALRIGYPAMVDAILDSIELELGQSIHVIMTGGDAAALLPLLRRPCQEVPLLTLEGIALAAGICL